MRWECGRKPFVRPCCGVEVADFDRGAGSIYFPHERDCRFWQEPRRARCVRVIGGRVSKVTLADEVAAGLHDQPHP